MINTDLSIQHEWIARRGFNNSFTLTFTESGSAFDVSTYTFVVNIRRIGYANNLLQLTQGSGITNAGATGIVTVQLSAANSILINADSYYYEIIYTVNSLTYGLLHGAFNLLVQFNPENEDDGVDIDVNLAGTNVNLEVNLASNISTSRVQSVTSAATVTPNADEDDEVKITSQAVALLIDNPSGTPTDGQGIGFSLKDNGVQRAISFGNKYRPFSIALPLVTTVSKWMRFAAIYNSTDDMWDVLPYVVEI